jgi:hypothetical protein
MINFGQQGSQLSLFVIKCLFQLKEVDLSLFKFDLLRCDIFCGLEVAVNCMQPVEDRRSFRGLFLHHWVIKKLLGKIFFPKFLKQCLRGVFHVKFDEFL